MANVPINGMYGTAYPQQYGGQMPQYQQQIRDGGLVRGRSKQEVWQYPVAPGYVVTFLIEQDDAISVFKKVCTSSFEPPQIVEYPCNMDAQKQAQESAKQDGDMMARLAALEEKVKALEVKPDEHDAE